jgi:hypothetical protein
MNFLSDLIINPTLTAHTAGQFYLKVDAEGKIISASNVEETDPTVGTHIKAITSLQINQWGQAFGWGDHALAGYALASRTLTAGTGLSGGGDLTANRTFSFDTLWGDVRYARRHTLIDSSSTWLYTSESGSYPGVHVGQITTGSSNFPTTLGGYAIFGGGQTNSASYYARVFGFFRAYDTTNIYVGTANDNGANNGWALIYTSYNLTLATLGGEPSFSKNTAFNKNFGTTAGTVAQGDDSRINNGQTAFGWGNHASGGYAVSTNLITAVTLTTSLLTLTRSAGNLTASVPTWNQNTTGSAATLTTARTLWGASFNGSANISGAMTGVTTLSMSGQLTNSLATGTAPFVVTSSTRVANLNVATAGTADVLTTARNINGTSFNGSANITTALWGTARLITIGATGKSVDGSANVAWTLGEIGAAAVSHTHLSSDITDLATLLSQKSNIDHAHTWSQISSKPNFDNKTQRLQITGASLSGTGSIEQQVAEYVNANALVARTEEHDTLFVEITDYVVDPGPGGGGTGIPSSGLVVHYDFNNGQSYNGTGSAVTDLSGAASNGTILGNNGIIYNPDLGGYLRFESWRASYINTNKSASALGIRDNSYSLSCISWSYHNGENMIWGTTDNPGTRLLLHAGYREANYHFDHYGSGGSVQGVTTSVWQHIVFVYDKTARTGKIYRNKILIHTITDMDSLLANGNLIIGMYNNSFSNFQMGNALVYNRALPQEDVDAIFDAQKTRFGL